MAELIDPAPSRNRDLVCAMLAATVIAPASKLATARGLRADTATSSLEQLLGVSGADEDDLYAAMDWVLARKDTIEDAWPPGIWPTAPWCFMTCPRRRSRATPARWARSGTPATGSRPAADRLRAAVLTGRSADRDRGVRGQGRCGVGSAGSGTGPVADRARRAAQTTH